jgi:ABC-type amino acid transport substrate-binding protein
MLRIALIVSICFSFFLLNCKPPQTQSQKVNSLSRISETKTIKVGYIVFPPCVVKDLQNQTLSGHNIATIEEIAKEAGWKIEYVETTWATFSAGLSTGEFDVSIAPTFVTVPRALSVSFTRPLFYAGNSAIVKKADNRFATIQSIDQPNVTVAVTDGEAGHEYAKTNFKQAKLIVHSGADQSLTFQDVLTGRADIALGDAYVTAQFAKQHPDQITDLFSSAPYNLTPVSWAVKSEDTALLQFLDSSIEALESQGRLLEFEKTAGAHWLHIKKEWEVF